MPPPKSAFRLKNFCFASRLASALAAAIELFDEIAPAEEELSDHVANPSSSIWLFDADVDGADLAPGAQGPTRDNDFIFHPCDGAAVISQFLMAPTAPVLRLKRCPPFASSSKILELSLDLSI